MMYHITRWGIKPDDGYVFHERMIGTTRGGART